MYQYYKKTHHYFEWLRILKSLFKVKQNKKT